MESLSPTSEQKMVGVNHWVSSIVNVDSKSNLSLQHLQSILGPVKEGERGSYEMLPESDVARDEALDNEQTTASAAATSQNTTRLASNDGYFTHEIVFQIDEAIFIETIKFYQKVCTDSSLMQIEALQQPSPSDTTADVNEKETWVTIWRTDKPLPAVKRPTVFIPNIKPTLFKTNTIKIVISGSIVLIDAIEVKGNKYALDEGKKKSRRMGTAGENEGEDEDGDEEEEEEDDDDEDGVDLSTYSALSRNLHSLVGNETFADVYFECDGKIVPAHRNILVSRSEYFRAMLSSKSGFAEATDEHASRDRPIYMKQIRYPQFKQVLLYLYTGHVETTSCGPTFLVEIIRVADLMNLTELEQLCLYHVSEMLDESNVIDVFVEANLGGPQRLDKVVQMCYDVIQANFAHVSRSAKFCALSQTLMLNVIENVVPRLSRLNSENLNNNSNNSNNDATSSTINNQTNFNS